MKHRSTPVRFNRALPQERHDSTSFLIARIERALVVLAYCIELDGDVHLPLYEKLEMELAAVRQRQDTWDRARKRLRDLAQTFGCEGNPLSGIEAKFK